MQGIILPDRAAWLTERSRGIGASDAAALLGLSRYKNAFELWHEKKGLIPPPEGETFARNVGLMLEDPIAEMYRQETGRAVRRPKTGMFELQRHPDLPFIVATLDGRTDLPDIADGEDDVPWECKTAAFIKSADWEHEPPLEYIVQVQHQMAVTGKKWASIAALVGGVAFRWADIQRDDEFIANLLQIETEFWESIQRDEPPPPDGSEITREVIKKLVPREILATPATLPAEAVDWDAARQGAKEEIAKWEAVKQEAEARIKLAIGEHAGSAILPNGARYTYKTINKKPYTVTPKPYRELRRFAPKGEKKGAILPGAAPSLDVLDDE